MIRQKSKINILISILVISLLSHLISIGCTGTTAGKMDEGRDITQPTLPDSDTESSTRITTSSGPQVDDNQARLDQISSTHSIYSLFTECFYREQRRMPESLDELLNSQWFWLYPVEQEFTEGLTVINSTTCDYDNHNTLCMSYSPDGYTFKALMPWGEGSEYVEWDLGSTEFVDVLENYYYEFDPTSGFIDRNPTNIRIHNAQMLAGILMANYWLYHEKLPGTSEELLDGKWSADYDQLGQLPIIDQGSFGSFYYGASPETGIMYLEYTLENCGSVVKQRIYIFNDPNKINPNAIGRSVCGDEGIERSDTVPIIDSSLPRWGF